MNWRNQKIALLSCGISLIVLLAFLLGIAYGTSSERDRFVDISISAFSAVGSWVSGIGALGAIYVALWLAEQQARKDREHINIKFSCVILPSMYEGALLCIEAVSVGQKPSHIRSLNISGGKNCTHSIALINFARGSSALPTRLGYGEEANYFLPPNFEKEIGKYIKEYCNGSANEICIYINTTTEVFRIDPDKQMKAMLESHAKRVLD